MVSLQDVRYKERQEAISSDVRDSGIQTEMMKGAMEVAVEVAMAARYAFPRVLSWVLALARCVEQLVLSINHVVANPSSRLPTSNQTHRNLIRSQVFVI